MKLLDCTMRDGGYHNKWNFTIAFANKYLQLMSELDVEYAEVGFRFLKNTEFLGQFAYSTESVLEALIIPKNVKIGVMVNAGEFSKSNLENEIESLFRISKASTVNFVRVAANFSEIDLALSLCSLLKKKYGYFVFLNIMQMAFLEEAQMEELQGKNLQSFDVLYFADSTGSMTPSKTREFFSVVSKELELELEFGIHAHDNCGNAFANSLMALEQNAQWADGTLFGMGRGPGNTKTEQLWLEREGSMASPAALASLVKFLDNEMLNIHSLFPWGSRPEYDLAARLGIHPTFVQNLLDDDLLETEDRLFALQKIRNSSPTRFSEETLNMSLNRDFQSIKMENNQETPSFVGKTVLILANGKTLQSHSSAVRQYIGQQKPVVITVNESSALPLTEIDYIATCNPLRFQSMVTNKLLMAKKIIAPLEYLESVMDIAEKPMNVIDFPISIKQGKFKSRDVNRAIPKPLSAVYAILLAISCGAQRIYLAGFDGEGMSKKQMKEMQSILSWLIEDDDEIKLVSLLETYLPIPTISIYGII